MVEPAQNVALRIDGGLIVTMDAQRRLIEDGSLAIQNGHIVDLGQTEELRNRYPAEQVIDARRKVVMPGLINAHAHTTAEFATRGLAPDGLKIFQWLEWMLPLYDVITPEEEEIASRLAFVECVKSGTTCFLASGTEKSVESVVRAAGDVGIRGVVSEPAMDVPTGPRTWYKTTAETLRDIQQAYDRYHGSLEGRISIWPIPLQPTFASPELLRALKKFADDHDTGLCMHSNYDPAEVEFCVQTTGCRPIELLESVGVLDSNTVLVHAVHVSDREFELLKKRDVKIVHCPATALRLAYGATRYGRFPEMLSAGLTVCLGCDGVNAASSFDMLRAMYLAAGLFKDCRLDASAIPAETALEMGTLNGARALRMDERIGSLEKGKLADVILLDRNRPEWNPLFNVANTLIYSATGDCVDTVLVNGRVVMERRSMTTINEKDLYEQIQQIGERMIERSGVKVPERRKAAGLRES